MAKLSLSRLPKTVLLATPLFMVVLCVLLSSNELSYLFVLQFVNQVAGQADLTFVPAQSQVSPSSAAHEAALLRNNLSSNTFRSPSLPLLSLADLKKWAAETTSVRGLSPRWLLPVKIKKSDGLLMVLDVNKQLQMGLGVKSNLASLQPNEVGISQELRSRMGVSIGSTLLLNFTLKNMFRGSKLLQKYQNVDSSQEYILDQQEINYNTIAQNIHAALQARNLPFDLPSTVQIKQLVQSVSQFTYSKKVVLKYEYKNQGLYATVLHNVFLMQMNGLAQVFSGILSQILVSKQFKRILGTKFKTPFLVPSLQLLLVRDEIQSFLSEYSLLAVATFYNPQLLYHPNKEHLPSYLQALQSVPNSCSVLSVYPLYETVSSIRYLFSSIVITFSFIALILYYFIFNLVFKRIAEEKSIEVAIWRTLGSGGTVLRRGNQIEQPSLLQKTKHGVLIFKEIAFVKEWVVASGVGLALYLAFRQIINWHICTLLGFGVIGQDYEEGWLLGGAALCFLLTMSAQYLYHLYHQPLAASVKPFKRTFDEVKVRVMKFATFGVKKQIMVVAATLVYYGVVAYYFIPKAVLERDQSTQTLLFDSILILMVLGAIILAALVQSHLQICLYRIMAWFSPTLHKIQSIAIKNIRAKAYTNVKASLIVGLLFAFLLFFGTGINAEISVVKAFIERQLGASLVIENYQKNSFNRSLLQPYLQSKGMQSAWLSTNLNRNGVKMTLDGYTKNKVHCAFKVITHNYLPITYYNYYYPGEYLDEVYPTLPNGVVDGFASLYTDQGHSRGTYNVSDTLTKQDPHHVNLYSEQESILAANQQQIRMVVSEKLLKELGGRVGDVYKLVISYKGVTYLTRALITHSFKAAPGLDFMRLEAFVSEQQGAYICSLLHLDNHLTYEKLFVKALEEVGNHITTMSEVGNHITTVSPEHTQVFESRFVTQSFALIQKYLVRYVGIVTAIVATLGVLFILVYARGKCQEEAAVYKVLRAVGVTVGQVRLMAFLDVFNRLLIAITNGILMGILFCVGVARQIEEVLLLQTPAFDFTSLIALAATLLIVFAVTVALSTHHLLKTSVRETAE